MKNFRKSKGFTLVEVSLALLVSVSILSGVGYLYLNASTAQQGDALWNEVTSTATLGFSVLAGAPADAPALTMAVESGVQFVSTVTPFAATSAGVPAYLDMLIAGQGTISNGWPSALIPQNVCTIAYHEITSAGYFYRITAPTAAITANEPLVTACPAGGGTNSIFLVKAAVQ